MKDLLRGLDPRAAAVVEAAAECAAGIGARIALVGGAVRDLLLGVPVQDLDFVAETAVDDLAACIAARLQTHVHRHERFQTFRIPVEGLEPVDVVTARIEQYPHPGALPKVTPASIEDDLTRRDFTINCLALELRSGALIDPLGGLDDLGNKVLRVLHDLSFQDDPTRLFRLFRMSARLGFEIEAPTRSLAARAVDDRAVRFVSAERIRRELDIALDEPRAPQVLEAFSTAGLLEQVISGGAAPAARLERIRSTCHTLGLPPQNAWLASVGQDERSIEDVERLWGASRAALIMRIRREAHFLEMLGKRTSRRLRLARAVQSVTRESLALVEPAALREQLIRIHQDGERMQLDSRQLSSLNLPGKRIGQIRRQVRAMLGAGLLDEAQTDQFARSRAVKYLSRKFDS